MKKLFVLLLALMLMLAACGPAATPTPEEPPPEEPAGVPTAEPPSDLAEVPVDQITDIVWQWTGYTEAMPAFQSLVADSENYNIVFSADGTVQAKADCNMAMGGYIVSGTSMSFTPGPMTLAECGPESQYDFYLLTLGQTGSFGKSGEELVLVSGDNNTRMIFTNTGPVETVMPIEGDPALLLGEPTGEDQFANKANWTLFDNQCFTSQISNGQYVMTAHGVPGACWEVSWPEIQDAYIQTTVEMPESCNPEDRFGMLLRAPDNNRGYLFGIDCGGNYTLRLWDGTQTTVLIEPTASELILIDPESENRLGLAMSGGDFYLYINGQYVDQAEDYTFLDAGKIGYFVNAAKEDEGFTVKYNDLAVWILEDTFYPPQAELPDYPVSDIPDVAEGANISANVNVNVRAGPGTQFRVIHIALQGDTGDAIGQSPDGYWWVVPMPEDHPHYDQGWVSKQYTTIDPPDAQLQVITPPLLPATIYAIPPAAKDPSAIVVERAEVRNGPGHEYPLVGLTSTGSTVKLIRVTEDGNWYGIELPSSSVPEGMGWMHKIYLDEFKNTEGLRVVKPSEYPPVPADARPTAPGSGAAAAKALETLSVLAGPSPSYNSYGKVDAGTIMGIVGRSADGKYWVINLPTAIAPSGQGWVDAGLVSVSKVETESVIPVIPAP